MPVPSLITDLSTTAASNSPAGTDPISNSLDDYLRAIQAIIRSESLNKSWEAPGHTATWLSGTQFTIPTDVTSTYRVGRRIKATLAGPSYAYSTITASAFAAGVTTVTVANDSTVLSSPISAIEVGPDSIAMIEAGSLVASRAWVQALAASETQAGITEKATAAEYQTGTDPDRHLTVKVARDNNLVASNATATSGLSTVDFTGIPAWAKRVTVMVESLSGSSTARPMIQLGTSGGLKTSGYLGSSSRSGTDGSAFNTSGFLLSAGVDANSVLHGSMTLTKLTADKWCAAGVFSYSNGVGSAMTSGSVTLSGALTQIRLLLDAAGSFDAGSINIIYE